MTLTGIGLCVGVGTLELAVEHVLDVELIGWSEVDRNASRVMAAHWPHAEALGDLTYRQEWPQADVVTAGFPCQTVSQAGHRRGTDDERWLWNAPPLPGELIPRASIVDALHQIQPGLVVLENVLGIVSLGGVEVVRDLTAMGYRVRWGHLRASAVGACHRRDRWFCVATTPGADRQGWARAWASRTDPGPSPPPDAEREPLELRRGPGAVPQATGTDRPRGHAERRVDEGGSPAGRRDEAPPHADGERQQGRPASNRQDRRVGVEPGDDAPRRDVDCERDRGELGVPDPDRWGDYAAAVARHELLLGRRAPDPLVGDPGVLAPLFVEWMMCHPTGWVTDHVHNRRQALRILGNGVVAPQAVHALEILL